jgi:hypothetical protein
MQQTMSSSTTRRSGISPALVAGALWIAAVVYLGIGFATVVSQVQSATGDLEVPFGLLGIPLLVGFRQAGRIGTHVGWGVALLLVAPFVVGMLVALGRIRRATP